MEKLAPEWPVHILSFEKNRDRHDEARMAAMRARLRAAGIGWTPLAYHKSPSAPATAYDIAVGTLVALQLALRLKVKIVHARSYVPALIALALKRIAGVRFLFDMRGLWADERVDGGLWPKNGRLYRTAKDLERRLLEAADHVVTLTHASAQGNRSVSISPRPNVAAFGDTDLRRSQTIPPGIGSRRQRFHVRLRRLGRNMVPAR